MVACPCGTGRALADCCGPFLAGASPATALELMRSRYSAFTLKRADHIERTCGGEAALRFDRNDLMRTLAATEWLGLTILSTSRGQIGDSEGTVTFRADFREAGLRHAMTETSQFRRIGGEWRYCSGTFATGKAAGPVGRNDPCPCGSGLKYKKCCGA